VSSITIPSSQIILKTSIAVGIGLRLAILAVDCEKEFMVCSELSIPTGKEDAGAGLNILGTYDNAPALFKGLILRRPRKLRAEVKDKGHRSLNRTTAHKA
jgi:hypothetical protein